MQPDKAPEPMTYEQYMAQQGDPGYANPSVSAETPLVDDGQVPTEPVPADPPADETVKATDKPADEPGEFTYVRLSDGSIDKVRTADIQNAPADGSKLRLSAPRVKPEEFYVHLSNGDVERVNSDELPAPAGAGAHFGFFEKDGKVFDVIGVYPVEQNGESK